MKIGIDIETKSLVEGHDEYALQPWRVLTGEAAITDVSVATVEGKSKTIAYTEGAMEDLLADLKDKKAGLVWWNGIFDLAFLYAAGHDLTGFSHIDGMHLWKWVKNSQRTEMGMFSWSLGAAAAYWLSDLPWCDEFVAMKKRGNEIVAGQDAEYWTKRAAFDALATVLISDRCYAKLNAKQKRAASVEGACLWVNAKAWVKGVLVNVAQCKNMSLGITEEMSGIEGQLGLSNPVSTTKDLMGDAAWSPSKILRSPKQKAKLVYEDWGFKCKRFTDSGAPSTDKAALTYLADDDDRFLDLMRWSELNTQFTKFINTPQEAAAYLGSDYLHPSPKIFSTYTGRMTYSGKTKRKFKTGCALHQWPRPKALRKLVLPPPGKKLVEFDAAGQENRLMSIFSGDPTMLEIFKNGRDIHSFTGADLAGISYEAFMKLKAEGNEAVVGGHGFRYQGKFNNLSNQYRVGVRTQRIQARVQYGMNVDFMTVKDWQDAWHRLYPGVKQYWKTAIKRAQELGYAETLGGRRFYLTHWSGDFKWGTESSAINFPIQGTAADMKELAVAVLTRKFPEFEYAFDLHDALFGYVDIDMPNSKLLEMRDALDNLPYKEVWGVDLPIDLLWDCQVGPNWGEMVEL